MSLHPEIIKAFRRGIRYPDLRHSYDWARDHVHLHPGGYAISGKFEVSTSRHLIAPLEALDNPRVPVVNILKATQTGGTLIADIKVLHWLANHPGPTLWNFNTESVADQHAASRFMVALKNCAVIRPLLPDDRHAIKKDQIIFRNGTPLYIQGSALSGLQAKSIRYLVNDEVWEWEPGRIREAYARVTAFIKAGTAKILNISQGGTVDDDWHRICKDSIIHNWHVPCMSCGEYFNPQIESKPGEADSKFLMRWNEDGSNIRLACPVCGFEMVDSAVLKSTWNERGKYIEEQGQQPSPNKTFRWNSLIWLPWEHIVTEYRFAIEQSKRGNLIPLKAFIQKHMADFWSEKENIPIILPETYDSKNGEAWPDEAYRFLTADVQEGHFWVVVRSWSKTGESRLRWFGKVYTYDDIKAKQDEFKVRSNCVFLDGAHNPKEVQRSCVRFQWAVLVGEDVKSFPHQRPNAKPIQRIYSPLIRVDAHAGMSGQAAYCPLFRWSNPSTKDILVNLRDGKGSFSKWLAYSGVSNEYFKQINSEKRKLVTNKNTGQSREMWVKYRDNHAWDCECMQVVAASMAGLFHIDILDKAS